MREEKPQFVWVKRSDGPDVCPACGTEKWMVVIGRDPCPECYVLVRVGE